MLRWARRIAIFLLLGAIVNVAVAWGLAIAHGDITDGGRLVEYGTSNRVILLRSISKLGYAYAAVQSSWLSGSPRFVPQRAIYTDRVWWPSGLPEQTGGHVGCGWPMLSLCAVVEPDRGTDLTAVIHTGTPVRIRGGFMPLHAEFVYPVGDVIPMIFPCSPLWRGFALNTVLYALLLASIIRGPGALRHAIRIRHRQCPACGYPRGASPVCTECGEPLPGVVAK